MYVLFQGGIEQRHPEALEIADPVGQAAYFTQQDVQQFLGNNPNWEWGDVWKLPVPWQSPYALNPFPKTRYSGFPADYEFSP
ncbi:MAG: hypothetical protein Q4G50_12005 [Corynebacterium sp.]|uniref:hypothetical protein n=1 Tax=Corynebacterium sp. TaxID=1720 RepID=UPI0026E0C712|nr:hypothetical protein [Corynebacterium sp.]MDO5670707.1 hypothetical protein [Corynebacterium sp.]